MKYFRRSGVITRTYRWCDLYKGNKLVQYYILSILRDPHIEESYSTSELLNSITIKRWEI